MDPRHTQFLKIWAIVAGILLAISPYRENLVTVPAAAVVWLGISAFFAGCIWLWLDPPPDSKTSRSPKVSAEDYPDDWDDIRRLVYRRDNYRCSNCGATDVELHAHHVVPLSVGGTNNVTNLITLCEACHTLLHPHMRDSTRPRKMSSEPQGASIPPVPSASQQEAVPGGLRHKREQQRVTDERLDDNLAIMRRMFKEEFDDDPDYRFYVSFRWYFSELLLSISSILLPATSPWQHRILKQQIDATQSAISVGDDMLREQETMDLLNDLCAMFDDKTILSAAVESHDEVTSKLLSTVDKLYPSLLDNPYELDSF